MPKKGVMSDREMFIDSITIGVGDQLGFRNSNRYIDKQFTKLENNIERLKRLIDKQNEFEAHKEAE